MGGSTETVDTAVAMEAMQVDHQQLHRGKQRRGRALLFVALLTACAGTPLIPFQRPTVELDLVEITGLGLSGGSLRLWLDVYNPNGYPLHGGNLQATVTLGETHFGDAVHRGDVTLPPREHSRLAVQVAFTWSGVGAAARSLLSRGSVYYDLEGEMRVGTPLGERAVPIRADGTVGIRDLVP